MSAAIAVVTGGSRGLGRNTVLALAARGVRSVLTYRADERAAAETAAAAADAGAPAVALQLDTGDTAGFDGFVGRLRAALADWGAERFDYLVNNAGIGHHAAFAETTEDAFDRLFAVLADGGRIVNVSSGLARFTLPGNAAYAATKGAVEVLTRYQAKELAARGITVNTVAPGAIETDFGGGVVRDDDGVNRAVAGMTALGRAGVPDDVGPMIAALLSDANRWVTGQRIEVSGGMNL